ncbi:hypothetical protein TVAG_351810 [Trichomonas vaginalis G3]|uniref:NAD-dependent epimerase/dehydratase domain-containing protein n=1 Tax=Trichomonas vaginalis (strain ATCC PRA-98 / G3) TaxID=412133 RepID=A2DZR5_TRIV3|nr:NAD dependent epimerase/dehydratase family [Trichomonas vaginalis G3]EAY14133.1 hypothetical protein TVAG_351810 [Trichomonas vaginalis G3]KAI5525143.1 NAD dependent epimerase/dehydratase family [Trichomonas vaginalis G3]|eukprot:XP_001326356.1 hypothetical protein [Trichomonas vaginalis G3]
MVIIGVTAINGRNLQKQISILAQNSPIHPRNSSYVNLTTNDQSSCPKCPSNFENLIPFGFDLLNHKNADEYILLLGSGGLIGNVLLEQLQKQGYKVLHILSRNHRDLRIKGSLDIFNDVHIKFAFFLSFEVGGAKYLQREDNQNYIYKSNENMMNNVFDWLITKKIKFAFASSSLSADNSSYGLTKLHGENITLSYPQYGRIFRLWNVYGFEFPGSKTHVVPDFIYQCISNKVVKPLTDGTEIRQFLHVNDVGQNLIKLMEHFDEAEMITDMSDGSWISIRNITSVITQVIPDCKFDFPQRRAKSQIRHNPNMNSSWHNKYWKQNIDLKTGIQEVYQRIKEFQDQQKNEIQLSIGIIQSKNDSSNVNQIISKFNSLNSKFSMNMSINVISNVSDKNNFTSIDSFLSFSKGKSILLINDNVIPDEHHMEFFQRGILQENILYIASSTKINSNKSNYTTASYFTYDGCNKDQINNKSIDFLAAKPNTFAKYNNFTLQNIFDQLKCGDHIVQLEYPVYQLD